MGILGRHKQITYLAQIIKGFFLVLFLTGLMLSQAMAADKIGAIAAVIGTVLLERDGDIISVKPGSPVFENDKVLTGEVQVALRVLSDGSNGDQCRSESRTRSR